MLHLADVGPLEALRPAAVDGRDQTLVAVHADDDVLRPHRADLHDAFLADDFDPRVVAVVAGADAGEATQPAGFKAQRRDHIVVEVLGFHAALVALEIGDFHVDALDIRAHQPAHAV